MRVAGYSKRRGLRRAFLAALVVVSGLAVVGLQAPPAAADSCSDCGESKLELNFYLDNGFTGPVTSTTYGRPVLMAALVSDDSDSCDIGDCNTPSGKAYFFDNGNVGYFAIAPSDPNDYTPDSSTDTNASFEATVANLGVGDHSIHAHYQSPIISVENPHHFDQSDDTKTLTITQASTSITSTPTPSTSTYGQNVAFATHVAPNPGVDASALKPTGNVQLVDVTGGGNTVLQTTSIDGSGNATLNSTAIPVGTRKLAVVYVGDTNYNAHSTGDFDYTVTKASTTTNVVAAPDPSTYGQTVTLTATVTPTTATGAVQFSVDGNNVGSANLNSSGVASLAHAGYTGGSHTVTATYAGDANYNGGSGSTSFFVNKADTSTAVSSPSDPSVFGQPITLNASVLPSDATGTVAFSEGATAFGTSTLSGGSASRTINGLSVGSHSLTATYSGDGNYNGSSAGVGQIVNKANTSTSLAGPANPVDFGANAKLTVGVAAVAPGAGTPTGTVTLREGTAVLGTATLNNALGTFTVADLLPGTHSMVATYNGDGNFNGSSSSPPVVVTVTCKTNKSAPTSGGLSVGSGSTCVTGDVSGSITLGSGARLFISHATVGGDITGSGASRVALCGVTVRGNLNLAGVDGPILIGDAVNNRCAGNTILGIASIQSTAKGLKIGDNSFGKDLNLSSNLKGTAVENNHIQGQLFCSDNKPKPTNNGRPNQGGSRFGQCTGL